MKSKLEKAIISLKKGNNNALGTIYDLTSKGVFTFVLPIVKNYATAEDVMQQTYIKIYENINSYNENTNPQNWILTIAKNIAINEYNKNKNKIDFDYNEEGLLPDGLCVLDESLDTPIIKLANKCLTEDEFKIVMMYTIGEYKHREIAEILNMPIGTVTWKYKNALNKLKIEIEKQNKYEAKRYKEQN